MLFSYFFCYGFSIYTIFVVCAIRKKKVIEWKYRKFGIRWALKFCLFHSTMILIVQKFKSFYCNLIFISQKIFSDGHLHNFFFSLAIFHPKKFSFVQFSFAKWSSGFSLPQFCTLVAFDDTHFSCTWFLEFCWVLWQAISVFNPLEIFIVIFI